MSRKLLRSEVFKLLNLYREHECLWNINSKIYRRNDLKIKAYEDIGKEMKLSVEDVKKKIKNLQGTYVQEKKKIDASMRSGMSADDVYLSSLFWFEEEKFLDESIVLRKTSHSANQEFNHNIEIADEAVSLIDEDEDIFRTSQPSTSIQSSGTSKSSKKNVEENKYTNALDKIVDLATKKNDREEDVYSAFAQSIALQLKTIPTVDAFRLMGDVQQLVTQRCVDAMSNTDNFFRVQTPMATSSSSNSYAHSHTPASSLLSSSSSSRRNVAKHSRKTVRHTSGSYEDQYYLPKINIVSDQIIQPQTTQAVNENIRWAMEDANVYEDYSNY